MAVISRNLKAHKALLMKVIKDQAGNIEKAVLEATMNSIEAGSDTVSINLVVDNDKAQLIIVDQGKGFCSETEIHEWFEMFGMPHKDSEGKIWAKFRMGRGQCFAFGKNVWRTGTFQMTVDVNNTGLDYELETSLPHFDGCRIVIDLYENPIGASNYRSVDAFKSAIRHHVEFMEGVIVFNGEQINTPASECTWDVESEDAYFMFGKGNSLSLYNIGAFVKDYSASRMGVTGVVVSKHQIEVNFARNDVMQSCEVWKRIHFIIRENKIKKVRLANRRLNSDERVSTLLDLRDGDCDYSEIKNVGLFELTDGKVMSLEAIRKIRSPWTFADPGSRIADHLMQLDYAICLSHKTVAVLDYFGEPAQFFDWLLKVHFNKEISNSSWGIPKSKPSWDKVGSFYRPFDVLSGGYCLGYRILSVDKLSKSERRFLRVMENYGWGGRILCIGVSDTANGWTDGSSYIAFNRAYIKRWNPQYFSGAAALVTLAYHELAHDNDDTGTHLHNVEFYQRYHDITRDGALYMIGELSQKMRAQKWQDQADEVAEKEAKKKAQRDIKLGIKRVAASKKVAASVSNPEKKVERLAKKLKVPIKVKAKNSRHLRF